MTITQQSLRQDANDSLAEFYTKESKLVEQIRTFEEALESARDDLRALRKEWKPRLKQAGKYKTFVNVVEQMISESPGIERSKLVKVLVTTKNVSPQIANSAIGLVLQKDSARLDDDNCLHIVNGFKTFKSDLKESIVNTLRNQRRELTVFDIARCIDHPNTSSLRACLKRLCESGKVNVNKKPGKSNLMTFSYREPVPKMESKQCKNYEQNSSTPL